jgi:hypothetical protein
MRIEKASASRLPHVYVLNMLYHTSLILLMKSFLKSASKKSNDSSSQGLDEKDDSLAKEAATVCVEAAKQIASLGDKYRQAYSSFRQGALTATHCNLSAALILMRVDDSKERGGRTKSLTSCIRTLEELSVSWNPAKRFWVILTRMVSERGHVKDGEERDIAASGTTGSLLASGVSSSTEPVPTIVSQMVGSPQFDNLFRMLRPEDQIESEGTPQNLPPWTDTNVDFGFQSLLGDHNSFKELHSWSDQTYR